MPPRRTSRMPSVPPHPTTVQTLRWANAGCGAGRVCGAPRVPAGRLWRLAAGLCGAGARQPCLQPQGFMAGAALAPAPCACRLQLRRLLHRHNASAAALLTAHSHTVSCGRGTRDARVAPRCIPRVCCLIRLSVQDLRLKGFRRVAIVAGEGSYEWFTQVRSATLAALPPVITVANLGPALFTELNTSYPTNRPYALPLPPYPAARLCTRGRSCQVRAAASLAQGAGGCGGCGSPRPGPCPAVCQAHSGAAGSGGCAARQAHRLLSCTAALAYTARACQFQPRNAPICFFTPHSSAARFPQHAHCYIQLAQVDLALLQASAAAKHTVTAPTTPSARPSSDSE